MANKIPTTNRFQSRLAVAQYSGPIPPADQLRGYEETCPGAADRILRMAENESLHRHKKELQIIKSEIFNERMGMTIAFTIYLIATLVSYRLISNGNSVAGSIVGGVTIVSVIASFISGRKKN